MTTPPAAILRDLGNGLIMRRATPADAEALSDFDARIHSDEGPDKPDEKIRAWVHDLLTRPHPTVAPGDFTIVEVAATGQIVSSLNLISQTWAYRGIPFGVGRPEAVGTLPEYRNRGLVRAQFEVIHQWSAERGQTVQAITGIPYYYRQFGYEMGLALGGGRSAFQPHVAPLKDGESEPYTVRAATVANIPFIAELDARVGERELVTCVRDEALWRYELEGRSPWNVNHMQWRVIESAAGEPVGYVAHGGWVWEGSPGAALSVHGYELKPGVSWLAVTPSVRRYLWAAGEAYAARDGKTMQRIAFQLGSEHPVYEALPSSLPQIRPTYAWYVRVPDLAGFLRHIAPALEARLASSIAAGHTADLKLSFYRRGLRLVLEAGRLVAVEPWQPKPREDGNAGFPDLTFLQLLFGYRALDELRGAFADCWVDGDVTRALLMALFPKQPTAMWAVG